MDLSHELQYAMEMAREAGRVILDHFGKVERLTKRLEEAVTAADRAAQRVIVAGLRRRYPRDGIVGEENDTGDAITFEVADPGGRVWVIDPIDGTNNFVSGFGAFAVCIGLLDQGRPVVGVVYDVTRDEMYGSAAGQGAWLGNRRLRVLDSDMGDWSVLMLTSNLLDSQGRLPAYVPYWLSRTNWKVRILGTAALEAVNVAAGVAHGAVTLNGKLWDVAAPAAIVIEAGGSVVSPDGQDIFPFDLRGYDGRKVPFVAAGPLSRGTLLRHIAQMP